MWSGSATRAWQQKLAAPIVVIMAAALAFGACGEDTTQTRRDARGEGAPIALDGGVDLSADFVPWPDTGTPQWPDMGAPQWQDMLQPPEASVDAVKPDGYVPPANVPTFSAPLSWDFETSCQGLAATGDWECGKINFPAGGGSNCDGSSSSVQPPPAGHSGSGVWGTKLNDCHSPLGNAGTPCSNPDPTSGSVLSFKVTLPPGWTQASMTYWGWDNYFLTFDWAEVRVNGQVAKQFCTGSMATTVAWTQQTVALSSYVGQTVLISFHFMATSVVNYAGWYIDDLAVSGS